ncbi:FHA domain-containing protein [Planctomycetota bacterium]
MRLTVKESSGQETEYRFARGPIYLGRHSQCHIFLPHRLVSRQHAVIYLSRDGAAILEDLRSANGTLHNGKTIHKTNLQSGDHVAIGEFDIHIDLENEPSDAPVHLDDTLVGVAHVPQVIVRELHAEHAPDITLAAERACDFAIASKRICRANGHQQTLNAILDILFEQFHPAQAWCALREDLDGPMTFEAGSDPEGNPITFPDLKLRPRIVQAVHEGQFILLPQNTTNALEQNLRSAIIAPLLETDGSVGVLYVDNRGPGEHYSLRDLDYLIFLSIHIAAVFENF